MPFTSTSTSSLRPGRRASTFSFNDISASHRAVLHYDASSNVSYPGSGTTFIDLTANNLDGKLVGSPTFNENHFELTGNMYIVSPDISKFIGGNKDQYYSNVSFLIKTNGSITDKSSKDANVILVGGVAQSSVQSKFANESILFDGVDDGIDVFDIPSIGTDAFTIEFWMYSNDPSGADQTLISSNHNDNNSFRLQKNNASSEMSWYSGSNVLLTTSGANISSGWQHIAVSRDDSNVLKIFVDGSEKANISDTSNYITLPNPISIGKGNLTYESSENPFSGYMEDIRLTIGDARYTNDFPTPTSEFKYNVTFSRTLDNPNDEGTSNFDNFSRGVGLSANATIVGAPREEVSGAASSGKVYIFDTNSGSLTYTIDNPTGAAGDFFGREISVSGNLAVIGAPFAANSSGKAYIYNVETGNLVHTIDNPNGYGTVDGDEFGSAVDISENYIVVGAYAEDDADGNSSGKAYIFSVSSGALLHTLDNPNPYGSSETDIFGASVAISDEYTIIGALNEDEASGNNSGKAYIFDSSSGQLLHTLNNPNYFNGTENDSFGGLALAINSSYAVVSAYGERDAELGFLSGKAYVFDPQTGFLLRTLHNPNPFESGNNDVFSLRLAMSGDYVVSTAYGESELDGENSGKAYIFNIHTGKLLHIIDNPNAYGTKENDEFGRSVDILNNTVVVGAYNEDDALGVSSGKAYLFKLPEELETNYQHTTEIWCKPTTDGVVLSYNGNETPNTGYYASSIEIISGQLHFGLWRGADIVSSGPASAISFNEWHQIVLTYDGYYVSGYLDGNKVITFSSHWDSPRDGTQISDFGMHIIAGENSAQNQGSGSDFIGSIGSLIVYDTLLHANAIRRNYNSKINNFT